MKECGNLACQHAYYMVGFLTAVFSSAVFVECTSRKRLEHFTPFCLKLGFVYKSIIFNIEMIRKLIIG